MLRLVGAVAGGVLLSAAAYAGGNSPLGGFSFGNAAGGGFGPVDGNCPQQSAVMADSTNAELLSDPTNSFILLVLVAGNCGAPNALLTDSTNSELLADPTNAFILTH